MEKIQEGPMRENSPLRIGREIKSLEVDFAIPRVIQIIPINSKGKNPIYCLKITAKGGATLV